MLKRAFVGVVAVAAAVSLAACGSNSIDGNAVSASKSSVVAPSRTSAPATPPVEESATPSAEAPVEDSGPLVQDNTPPSVTSVQEVPETVAPVPPSEEKPLSTPESTVVDVPNSTPAVDTKTLVPSLEAPGWYIDDKPGSIPGEFTDGTCRHDLYYYPVLTMSDPQDAVARFEGRSDGIYITVYDSKIRAWGFEINVSPTTAMAYTAAEGVYSYFVPNANLGQDPELTKQKAEELGEIGMCAVKILH